MLAYTLETPVAVTPLEAPKMDEVEVEDNEEEACWPICEAARDSNVADGRL